MSTMHWRGISEVTDAIAFEVHGKRHVLFEQSHDGRIFIYARHGDLPWEYLGVICDNSVYGYWLANPVKAAISMKRCSTRREAINYILEAA